jgi:hypothetical protein
MKTMKKPTTINGKNIAVARTVWKRVKRPSMRTMALINTNIAVNKRKAA